MAEAVDDVIALLDEVRLLFHRAAQVTEGLHGPEEITAGGRAVLEHLENAGPMSASELARRRHVSRQHIQLLVNSLLERELVTAQENPSHRRSPLLALTPIGARTIRRMTTRERRELARLDLPVAKDDLIAARDTLAALRTALGGMT
jgi:DNA-binding MarR family transcriptional regulator